jgi:hypothetical protein
LNPIRTIFAVLIALSLAVGLLSPAFASSPAAEMAGMEDCDQKPKGECPCCDTKNACPPEFCLTKCLKLMGEVKAPRVMRFATSLHRWPSEPGRPPDWTYGPQPPPPRL